MIRSYLYSLLKKELVLIATKMVAVKNLSPGLVLSDAVITPAGKTLLNAG